MVLKRACIKKHLKEQRKGVLLVSFLKAFVPPYQKAVQFDLREVQHNLPPRSEVGGCDEGGRLIVVRSEVMIRNKASGKTKMSATTGCLFRSSVGFGR